MKCLGDMSAQESTNVCICMRKNKINKTFCLFKKDLRKYYYKCEFKSGKRKLFAYRSESGKANGKK